MYSNLTMLNIGSRVIEFQEVGGNPISIMTKEPMNFKDAEVPQYYEDVLTNDLNAVMIFEDFLKVKHNGFWHVIYLPKIVRYYIRKDVGKGKFFALSYRKHIETEFSCKNFLPVSMPPLTDARKYFWYEKIAKTIQFYSLGKVNYPIAVFSVFPAKDDHEEPKYFCKILKFDKEMETFSFDFLGDCIEEVA